MPPTPDQETPRLVLYQQTHHDGPTGKPISLLPLIDNNTGITHLYIAAIHLNDRPENITLNDHPPEDSRYSQLWHEVKQLQSAGVKVMGMLGGAAKGSYQRLGHSFEEYYRPLEKLIRARSLDGLDLDVEEAVPLPLVTRLLKRLKSDFGRDFILTLAPVFPALLPKHLYLTSFTYRLLHPELPPSTPLVQAFIKPELLPSHNHLSGFNHFALEASEAGKLVSWYNVQFYCGWGDASNPRNLDALIASGWDPKKVVVGVVTNPANGSGHVDIRTLIRVIGELREKHGNKFGGVMGWEYFNAGLDSTTPLVKEPWEWVQLLKGALQGKPLRAAETTSAKPAGTISEDPSGAPISPPVPEPIDSKDIASALEQADQVAKSDAMATTQGDNFTEEQSGNTTASTPNPNEEHIRRLVQMGFERPEAIAALEAMDGDVDGAASLLIEEE